MKKKIIDIALKEISFFTSVFVGSTIITVSAGILILYFRNDPAMANAFSTLATIILAFAAITAIWYGSQQSKRLKEENQRNTEIQRRKDLLNDIKDWATDVANFTIAPEDLKTVASPVSKTVWGFLALYWNRTLDKYEISGKSLKRRSENIWPNIDSELVTVLTNIDSTCSFLVHSPNWNVKIYGDAIELVYKLNDSAKKVIEEVDNIEIKGIN